MKTITSLNSHSTHRLMHYVRLAFISGASTAFLCHSGQAQPKPDESVNADNSSSKPFTYQYKAPAQTNSSNTISYPASDKVYQMSKITTGPCYKFNITSFVYSVLPTNTIQFSDNSAVQMNKSALMLDENATALSAQAQALRVQAKQAGNRWLAVALCKKADSIDALSANLKLQATETTLNAEESQYEANLDQVNNWQHNSTYSSDLSTSANLLTNDAGFYYAKSLNETTRADSSARIYVKQSLFELAQKNMEAALLKQQCAENIYISIENSKSVAIAEKIDSILSTPDEAQLAATAKSFGNIVFCVKIGSYTSIVPIAKANKLLKIAGLGITKHTERDGVTTFTIGQYTSSACAYLLSQELAEDGYAESVVITYQNSNTDGSSVQMIANK